MTSVVSCIGVKFLCVGLLSKMMCSVLLFAILLSTSFFAPGAPVPLVFYGPDVIKNHAQLS